MTIAPPHRRAVLGVAALLLLVPLCGAQQARPARTVSAAGDAAVTRARRAFDARTVAPLRANWLADLRRTPGDRIARLGLATLDYLQARYAPADSIFVALINERVSDDITTQAWLGRSVVAGNQGKLAPADSFASTALQLARRADDRIGIGGALLRLAQYRVRTAGAPAALALLTAADSFVSRARPEAAASVACARAQIRNISSDSLAYRDALRGIALLPRGTGGRVRSACYFAIGQHFTGRGGRLIDSTARYLRLAAREQQAIGDGAGRAASLQWLGSALANASRYSEAIRVFGAALEESEQSRNRSARAWTYKGLGEIRLDLGDDVAGVAHMLRAAGEFRELGDQVGYQATQLALFHVRLRRGDTVGVAQALPETEAVLLRLGDRLARQRVLLMEIGLARTRRDRPAARALAEELWAQFQRDGRGTTTSIAFLRGVTALEAGALDAAAEHFAVPDRKLSGNMRSYLWLARAAEVAARRGDLNLAERRLREAHTAFAEFRQTLTEPELRLTALQGFGLDQVDPDLGVATVIHALATGGRAASAFGLAAERRGRELTDALLRAAALSDRNTLPSVTRSRAAESLGSDTAVRAVLAPNEAMLFFVTGQRSEPSTAFVVTRQRVDAATVMSADSLQPLASRLRRVLEARESADALRQQLGVALIGPVMPVLPTGITRLIIVGDGPISSVPFDVLRLPDGATMLDRYDLALLASPAVLPILRQRVVTRGAGTLALAVEQPGRASPISGRMMPVLQGANREVRDIAARRRPSQVLLGFDARESALYLRADTLSTLHIAAHAVVDPVMESRSAIMLASGGGQDGDLHPWEMDRVNVSAGLVVLSACRTNLADGGRGDGLRGFTAPMLLAGTQAVVATQWDLGDRAAAEIMREFHRQLNGGADAGVALRAAKRMLASRGRPPSEWAVFQLIGDPAYRTASR